jgi:hypothetical protein
MLKEIMQSFSQILTSQSKLGYGGLILGSNIFLILSQPEKSLILNKGSSNAKNELLEILISKLFFCLKNGKLEFNLERDSLKRTLYKTDFLLGTDKDAI